MAEIKLANSFSVANAGPPTSPPEARQMPGTIELCNERRDDGHHRSEHECEDRKDRGYQQLGIAATSQRKIHSSAFKPAMTVR